MENRPLNVLCIASFFKGSEFMVACQEAGANVYLLTSKKLENKPWPRASLTDVFYMEDKDDNWDMEIAIKGLAYIFRENPMDRIVALDDFDVEKGAFLRENFRIPGMGQTTARYFRDKLAMRMRAQEFDISVPEFTPVFSNEQVADYLSRVSAPWVLKPRSEASATGIKKLYHAEDVWKTLHEIGEERHMYVLEQFRPGDVYHLDALSVNGEIIFCKSSRYLSTPMEVAHGGGIFRSITIEENSKDDKALKKMNTQVMKAFGMQYSASHTEYIKCHEDGKYYFLETSSRVGGAHLSDMVEAATGINLWAEWAKIEVADAMGTTYNLPKADNYEAGIIVSLARELHPDVSSFQDAEIYWKMNMDYHVGLIVRSKEKGKVVDLLDKYAERVKNEFHASAPIRSKPTN